MAIEKGGWVRVWYRRIVGPRSVRIAIALLVLLAGSVPAAGAAADAGPSTVTLPGHVLKILPTTTRLSSVAPGQSLTLTVALRPSSPAGLSAAAARARSVGQGSRAFLSPQAVGQSYGQSAATIGALASYFARFGLTVAPPRPDHLSFQVSGAAAQIEPALSVSLANYQDRRGRRFYATSNDPRLPANLAGAVQAIFGLDNYAVMRPLRAAAAGTPGAFAPADLQAAYNVTPLYRQGLTGAGQTIAILGCDTFNISDIRAFESTFGLPTAPIQTTSIDGGGSGASIEGTLDLEWSGAIATGASLMYYSTPYDSNGNGCTFQGIYDGLGKDVSDNQASVLSISLGACEASYSGSESIQAFENEFSAAAAEGQSIMVASGDSGAFGCADAWGNPILGVAYPGSSAYVTSVGGTSLSVNGDGSYAGESAWGSESECGGPCGGGGGVSQIVPKPSWQAAVNSSSNREVPDVSLNADPATGNLIYYTGPSCQPQCGLSSGWGGTSIAAPQWAGLAAIADQAAGHRLGLLDPQLYGPTVVNAQSSPVQPYHDVTSGNNLYYSAVPGWDMATGWGSPNACNLVSDLVVAAKLAGATVSTPNAPGSFRVFLPVVVNYASACGP
ncbi:MAG: S53 family peptidase [Chloroflexota bacterium]